MKRTAAVFALLMVAFAVTACGTIDRCTADTSPPKDGVQQPLPRH